MFLTGFDADRTEISLIQEIIVHSGFDPDTFSDDVAVVYVSLVFFCLNKFLLGFLDKEIDFKWIYYWYCIGLYKCWFCLSGYWMGYNTICKSLSLRSQVHQLICKIFPGRL